MKTILLMILVTFMCFAENNKWKVIKETVVFNNVTTVLEYTSTNANIFKQGSSFYFQNVVWDNYNWDIKITNFNTTNNTYEGIASSLTGGLKINSKNIGEFLNGT